MTWGGGIPFFDAVMGLNADNGGEHWHDAQDYLLLMLFTGCRREEVLSLKWSNIDFKLKTLMVEDTKNKEQHVLPLSDYLFALLSERNRSSKGIYVFASAKNSTYRTTFFFFSSTTTLVTIH